MSEALSGQQQALLRALSQPRHEDAVEWVAAQGLVSEPQGVHWRRGLTAYRSNGHEIARRALAAAYPVVAQLLGEENFPALAQSLWMHHPPRRGDIAHWGAELAAHIESLPDLREQEPFVADVARVEWLLHTAASATDASLDTPSLQLLAREDPSVITLSICPGAACVASGYPVVSIINAHVDGEPSLQQAGERLRAGVREAALVWREGFKPRLRETWAGEAAFIAALQEKRSLLDSLEAAAELDFNQWLAAAVQSGLLIGAARL